MKIKKFVALLLCVLTITTSIAVPISAEAAETEKNTNAAVNSEPNVKGANSFGSMIMSSMQSDDSDEDAEENSNVEGFGICDVVISGNVASVEYTAAYDCKMVVSLYDEETGKMLAAGNADVSAAENVGFTDITIKTDNMPEYFDLKVFLMDKWHNPLCDCYSSSEYNKLIQEVKNSVISDYDSDLVINLDNDDTTNFLVCNDKVKMLKKTGEYNVPVNTMYDENGVYVFKNCNDDFKSLKKGDLVSYIYEDDIILLNIQKITVNGDTVTVTTDTSSKMDTFFNYVKIEDSLNDETLVYDGSEADEGVTFQGFTTVNGQEPSSANGIQSSGSVSATLSEHFDLGHTVGNVSVTGTLWFSNKVTLDLYINWGESYFEYDDDCITNANVKVNGKADFTPIKLGKLVGSFTSEFIELKLEPSFVVSVVGSVSLEYNIETDLGFTIDKDGLHHRAYSKQKDIKGSQTLIIFLGIDFGPKLNLLNGQAVDIDLKIRLGVEATLKNQYKTNGIKKHLCNSCDAININLVLDLGVTFSVVEYEFFKTGNLLRFSYSVSTFYYSADYNEFGEGSCPHVGYKTVISATLDDVTDRNTDLQVVNKYNDKEIYNDKTNAAGKATFYLPTGEYYVIGHGQKQAIKIYDRDNEITVKFNTIIVTEDSDYGKNTDTDKYSDTDTEKAKDTDKPKDTDKETEHTIPKTHNEETTALIASGNCGVQGDNVKWALYKSGTLYIYGKGKMKDYSINYSSFDDNRNNIINVVIENGVTSIGNYAFWERRSLTSIEIPNSVTSVGDYAFDGCSSLVSIEIPNSVTSIGRCTLYGCSSLVSIEIPNSVTWIRSWAFYGCKSLKDVYYTGTEEQWEKISIGIWNGPLNSLTYVTIHYNSKMPNSSGSSLPNSSTATITNYLAPKTTPTATKLVVSKSANKEYTGLVQKGRYIFMLVKSDKAENLVSSDNLVYIDQFTADENGVVTADYPDTYGNEYTALIFGGKTTANTAIDDTDSDTDTDKKFDTDIKKDTDTDKKSDTDIKKDTDTDKKSDTDTDKPTTTTYILGDVDGDKKLTSADSLKILRASVKLEKLDDVQTKLADVNGDGNIDSSDSLITLRASVGLYDNPNVGKNISIKTKAS